MIEDFVYLISSHVDYAVPRNRLLNSMKPAGISPSRVISVIGGASKDVVFTFGSLTIIACTHNSFDFTALIGVLDHNLDLPSHIFTMHDTMEVEPRTDEALRNVDPAAKATGVWSWMSNLIMVRTDWLHACREQVLALRNCSKLEAVRNEGLLWKIAGDSGAVYPDGAFPLPTSVDPVYGGANRIREYYANVGITKWKANWGQSFTEWETRP